MKLLILKKEKKMKNRVKQIPFSLLQIQQQYGVSKTYFGTICQVDQV